MATPLSIIAENNSNNIRNALNPQEIDDFTQSMSTNIDESNTRRSSQPQRSFQSLTNAMESLCNEWENISAECKECDNTESEQEKNNNSMSTLRFSSIQLTEAMKQSLQNQIFEIDVVHDTTTPSLDTICKNQKTTLYLFDNADTHQTVKMVKVTREPNVVFIRTMNKNGIAFSDKNIISNIESFQEDILKIKEILDKNEYSKILIPSNGFGVNSKLCLNAPETWFAFKNIFNAFFDIYTKDQSVLKWQEWEANAKSSKIDPQEPMNNGHKRCWKYWDPSDSLRFIGLTLR